MALRVKKSTNQRYTETIVREPHKKIFIVCEGDITEVRYFQGLKDNSKDLGINDLLEIIIMEKDSESKGTSDPYGLIELAKKMKSQMMCDCSEESQLQYDYSGTYDDRLDKFMIVIDRDKGSFLNYRKFIDDFKDEFVLGITNPCFELWLLLHKQNAVTNIINPQYEEILENNRISNNHTFVSDLVSREFHMNPKTGMRFAKFKENVIYAIDQEKALEQDLYMLEDRIGSNIGMIIETEILK